MKLVNLSEKFKKMYANLNVTLLVLKHNVAEELILDLWDQLLSREEAGTTQNNPLAAESTIRQTLAGQP